MAQRVGNITLKVSWKNDDSRIFHANVFQCFVTPYMCSLYLGFINPENMLPPPPATDQTKEKIVQVNMLGKYSLDMESFIRLKGEIDKAHKLLKDMGALEDDK